MKINNKYFRFTIEKKKYKKSKLIKINFETKMSIKKIIADLFVRLIKLICSLVKKLIVFIFKTLIQKLVAIILDYIMNRLFYKQLILNKRMSFFKGW